MRNSMLSAPIRPRVTRREASDISGVAEAMVADARGQLTPAELVEQKIASTLKTSPLPISSLRTRTTMRRPK